MATRQRKIVTVPKDKVDMFFITLQDAFMRMHRSQLEELRLYVAKRHAVTVSYDADWQPFMGFTAGYNDPDDRVLLDATDWVLGLVSRSLRAKRYSIPGGRMFLDADGAYRAPHGSAEYLCWWNWRGMDIVEGCLDLLEEARFH